MCDKLNLHTVNLLKRRVRTWCVYDLRGIFLEFFVDEFYAVF